MRWLAVILPLSLAACAELPSPVASGPPPAVVERPAPQSARPPARPVRRTPEPGGNAGPVWRVVADGTTGCADAAALRLLREAPGTGAAALRRLAAARAAGGCVTAVRAVRWRALDAGGGVLRLAPVDGGAPLFFWRDEVAEDRTG